MSQQFMPSLLGLIFALSEAGLALGKRAKASEARIADRGSLWQLWLVIFISVNIAYGLPSLTPSLAFGPATLAIDGGMVLFAGGLALRWYSILYLGRLFTVNVAIDAHHRLIDSGPYRFIRHPSYTGALMAFIGLGFCLQNWASLAVIGVPTLMVFLRRIRIEEAVLSHGLGEPYIAYMRRTKRLIPAVY